MSNMNRRGLGAALAIVAGAAALAAPDHRMGHGRVRPGMFPGITFEPNDPAGTAVLPSPGGEAKDLAEAVGLFVKARDEYHAEVKKYGEATQELKNNLNAMQEQLDKFEAKEKRPPVLATGAAAFTEEDAKRADAFYKLLVKGKERFAAEHPDEVKLLSVGDDAGGGHLAPAQLLNEIIKDTVEYSPVRGVARVRQTANKSIQLPKRTATPSAQWTGEGGQVTGTNSKYGMEEIPAHVLTAMSIITVEMLEDGSFNMASELQADGAEQFGAAEGTAFVLGDGNKKPEGFLFNADVKARAIASGNATKLLDTSLVKACYALKTVYADRATWAMNRLTLREVRLMKDLNGQFVWRSGLEQNKAPSILERPYIECPDMPAPNDAGEYAANEIPVVLADFGRGYVVVDRTVLTTQRDDNTLADQGLVRFILRRRVGGQVVLAVAFQPIKISA